MARTEDPIQNLDTVDIVGRRPDGGVDLLLVVTAAINDSEQHQRLLLAKLEAYLRNINTLAFRNELGPPTPDRVRIVVSCEAEPHPAIRQLLQNAMPWIEENNASLALQVTPRPG